MTDVSANAQSAAISKIKWKREFTATPSKGIQDLIEMTPSISEGKTSAKTIENWAIAMFADASLDEKHAKGLLRAIAFMIEPFYENLNTRASFFSRIRTIVESRYPKDSSVHLYSYKTINIKKTDAVKLRTANVEGITERARDQFAIHISEIRQLIAMALAANSKEWELKAMAFELAVGARVTELLIVSSFALDPENKDDIIQTGLMKTHDVIYSIARPVMFMRPEQALKLLNDLRSHLKSRIDKLHSKYGPKEAGNYLTTFINKKINVHIKAYETDGRPRAYRITTHDLRRIYANAAFDAYTAANPGQRTNANAYISQVLGHAVTDMASAMSYANMYIDYNS